MSWAEVKKINSDLGTPLDSLIKKENASRRRIFFYTGSAQNFTVPDGVTKLFITACGGGGGETAGGNTIIGSLVTLPGGAINGNPGGSGGGSGGTNTAPAGYGILGAGGAIAMNYGSQSFPSAQINGGGGSLGSGFPGFLLNSVGATPNAGAFGHYGGGGGRKSAGSLPSNGAGGGAAIWNKEYTVTPGSNISITVGACGTDGTSRTAGGPGIVIIEW